MFYSFFLFDFFAFFYCFIFLFFCFNLFCVFFHLFGRFESDSFLWARIQLRVASTHSGHFARIKCTSYVFIVIYTCIRTRIRIVFCNKITSYTYVSIYSVVHTVHSPRQAFRSYAPILYMYINLNLCMRIMIVPHIIV